MDHGDTYIKKKKEIIVVEKIVHPEPSNDTEMPIIEENIPVNIAKRKCFIIALFVKFSTFVMKLIRRK